MTDQKYTKEQLKYIDSVDGNAHQSGVNIIGDLCKQRDELRNTVETVVDFMWVSNEAKIVRKLGWILQILKDVLTKTKEDV